MTDQADLQAQLLATLQAQQAQLASMHPQPQTPAASPWASAPISATPSITGVAVPVKIQTPAGSIRVYFSLPAECAASPEALMSALEALSAAGLPLDTWSGRESGSGSSWGGSGNRSGYGNSRNNWRR